MTGWSGTSGSREAGSTRRRAWSRCSSCSPLSVAPELHSRGIGRALVAHAVAEAKRAGVPAVFLEGDPAYYVRLGWRPAAELGVTPPSGRIPKTAFQAVPLPAWEPWMRGALVYADTFWAFDCVGLRGERLARTSTSLKTVAPADRAASPAPIGRTNLRRGEARCCPLLAHGCQARKMRWQTHFDAEVYTRPKRPACRTVSGRA